MTKKQSDEKLMILNIFNTQISLFTTSQTDQTSSLELVAMKH